MNDSLRTNVFVRFQVETIACACIYLAARALQVSQQSATGADVTPQIYRQMKIIIRSPEDRLFSFQRLLA